MTMLQRALALDPGTRHRVVLQVRSDSGTWVDFSSIEWESFQGYGDCLLDLPELGWQADRRKGDYADSISTIKARNDRFSADEFGMWDQAISRSAPLTVNGYTFSAWARRLVRVQVKHVPAGRESSSSVTVGVFELIDVKRNSNRSVDLKIRSLFDRLKQRDPATILDGASWYRGRTMGFLLRRLLSSALPEGVSFNIPDAFGLPAFPDTHTSSLGQTPGQLTTGELAPTKWVVRCMCTDPANADVVYFGLEDYGLHDQPDGALAKYDLTTRKWTILADASTSTYLEEWVPRWIRIMDIGGTNRLVTMCSTEGGINSINSAHWYIRRSVWNASTGAHITTDGQDTWHPGREVVRQGWQVTGIDSVERTQVGYTVWTDSGGTSSDWWYDDAPLMAIPQTVDNKNPWLNGSTDEDAYFSDPITGIYSTSHIYPGGGSMTGAPRLNKADQRQLQSIESSPVGQGCIAQEIDPSPQYGGHRYYMSDLWGARPVLREGNFWWLGKNDGSTEFRLKELDTATGTTTGRSLALGSNQFWSVWPTAFSSAGNQSGTTIRFYLAVASWVRNVSGVPQWAASTLYLATVSGSSVTLTPILSESPSGDQPATARHIVDIFVAEEDYEAEDGDTGPTVVAVVLDGMRLGNQPFGVYVGEASTLGTVTWYQRFGETGYVGPVSSLPFSGFVEDVAVRSSSLRAFHFVDQATGMMWRLECNLTANTCTYQPVNAGDPISSETHLAADRGLYTTDSTSTVRTLFACAPDSAGDVRNGYWQRSGNQPAAAIYVPGIYPLVQYSLEQSDVIDVADFAEYGDKSLGAVRDLLRLAPGYSMGWVDQSGTPTLTIAKRDEVTDSTVVFRDESEVGLVPVDPSTAYLPLSDISAHLDWSGTYSAVEVVPHAFQAIGEPEVRALSAAGSKFGGEWTYASKTDRAIDVSIRSASSWVAGSVTRAPLMRWQVLAETVFLYLAQAASASATTIYVGGITYEAGEYYAGSVRIRETGVLKVLDGSEVTYTIVGLASGWGGVEVSLSAAIGVDAAKYAQVELTTNRQDSISDGPNGVTTVEGIIGSTYIPVNSSRQIRRGMALLIDSELMLVTKVAGQIVYVDRAQFGTTLANHSVSAVVRAYVCPQVPGKLYQVGDTGIEVGVQIDAEDSIGAEERQVSPGDGLRVTTKGYALQPMEHARRRVVSSACVEDINGARDLTIDDNRFCDFGKSLPLAVDTLADVCEPRQIISATCPLYGISQFTRAKFQSPRWHFGSTSQVEYEITSARYNPRSRTVAIEMRSLAAIPNSGSSLTTPGTVSGLGGAQPAGKRRR